MEKVYFRKLLSQAWVASRVKKLPWIFASVVALAGLTGNHLNADFGEATSPEELFHIIVQKSPQEAWYIFLGLFIFFVISIVGKSNLIASLSFITYKNNLPNYPTTLRAIGSNFIRSFFLECIALLFLIATIAILSLPLLIASETNPGALPSLIIFSSLTFIPIALTIFLMKQFALFYLLLSPLGIRGSIETSGVLFSRFFSLNLLFIFFTFLVSVLFTFLVNLVILGITVLSKNIPLPFGEGVLPLIVSFVSFTWFALFEQALWLAFFQSIGGKYDQSKAVKEKENGLDAEVLPEVPPAQ